MSRGPLPPSGSWCRSSSSLKGGHGCSVYLCMSLALFNFSIYWNFMGTEHQMKIPEFIDQAFILSEDDFVTLGSPTLYGRAVLQNAIYIR